MEKERKKEIPKEFKAEIARLIVECGKSVQEVSLEHELNQRSIQTWVRQAKADAGLGPPGALTTAEKQELDELRRENRELRRERDFLRQAAAYFAKVKK